MRSNIAKTSVTKMRSIKRKTFFGAGKLHEIALHIKQNNIDCVFINCELTSL
jgi:50S ribosomal subunit-associated GTPase HflX